MECVASIRLGKTSQARIGMGCLSFTGEGGLSEEDNGYDGAKGGILNGGAYKRMGAVPPPKGNYYYCC